MRKLKFIDLFAGLGGFHLALKDLGHTCVFASEINDDLRILYKKNFEFDCKGDINSITVNEIPAHDILCGGFPCQPFSKAGKQNGLDDSDNGNCFNKIMEIVSYHNPEYIFLENVPNLKGHDDGNTWAYIYEKLSANYEVKEKIMSPHKFGVPQHRSRIYIVCRLKSLGGLNNFEFPEGNYKGTLSIHSIIEQNPQDYTAIKEKSLYQLEVWQEFLDNLKKEEVPGFPIWAMEFGADYPFEDEAPIQLGKIHLQKYKGKFGKKIKGNSFNEVLECLPIYAQVDQKEFPHWKKYYIRSNRMFYEKHKHWLDDWMKKILEFENSHQKFEWNCGTKVPLKINDKIVQFRPSGIWGKMPNFSSALAPSTNYLTAVHAK
jgi:DNA (cytosine-5)-methyltransferase 1